MNSLLHHRGRQLQTKVWKELLPHLPGVVERRDPAQQRASNLPRADICQGGWMAEESIQVFHTCMSFILTRESTIHLSLLRTQRRLLKLCCSVLAFTLLISCAVFMSSQHEEEKKKTAEEHTLFYFEDSRQRTDKKDASEQ